MWSLISVHDVRNRTTSLSHLHHRTLTFLTTPTQRPTQIHAPAMPPTFLQSLLRPSIFASSPLRALQPFLASTIPKSAFLPRLSTPASRAPKCTLIQVLRQGRIAKPARKLRSPQLRDRPELKGVCLKVGTTKPKKPNSGERKIARVRLSTGKVITAYIPGEGTLEHIHT